LDVPSLLSHIWVSAATGGTDVLVPFGGRMPARLSDSSEKNNQTHISCRCQTKMWKEEIQRKKLKHGICKKRNRQESISSMI
jgi:hypothetical protein